MTNLALALSLAGLLGATSLASAQTAPPRVPHRAMAHTGNGVAANGRCGGISYGTGARRCGSATGGPSGGLSSRN